jgi:heme-degrading monooxygenase HmoA
MKFNVLAPFVALSAVISVSTVGTGCYLEQPFEGPGFSLGDGITTDAEGPFTASTTSLILADGDEPKQVFDKHMAVLGEKIKTQPGLIGFSLALPIGSEGYRTLTVWESEDAMLEWVVSDEHLAAMDEMADKAKEGSAVTSWKMERAELEAGPPSWEDARKRLEDTGRTVY